MALSIKSKIAGGIGILFALLVTVSIVAIISINLLSYDTENLLAANYNTIKYCSEMSNYMADFNTKPSAKDSFNVYLRLQENNITEPGEYEATARLRSLFEKAKINGLDSVLNKELIGTIYHIYVLNEVSLRHKNDVALKTASNSKLWLTCLSSLLVLISFSFVLNFPGYIANPIRLLTEGIREIGKKNYEKRIFLESGDEFGEMAQAFNQMARRLYEYEHSNLSKIMFEKKRVETIINQMEDAVVGLDAQKNLLFINHNAEKLFNLNEQEVVAQPAEKVAQRNDLFKAVFGRNNDLPPLKIIADGRESYYVVQTRSVYNEDAQIGEVITLKNITTFKELDLSKTNLLATISHELKTPIASIKMSTRLLKDDRVGSVNNEQKELVRHIDEDADRLLRITGELLNMAQLETGNIQLKLSRISPLVIVTDALQAVQSQAAQKNITIITKCTEDMPHVLADSDKTSWVLINLLTNAIRYSEAGATVMVVVEALSPSKVQFSVQDEGRGIEQKYLSRIFDRYFRVPGANEKSGTGLGLSISREFIEAQGGDISVNSEFGKGSTFSFRLPA